MGMGMVMAMVTGMVTDMATMNPVKEPKVEEHTLSRVLFKIYLMKNDIICSIIIRSYNEEKHIGRLIDGINKQKNVTGIEIIVVDSGSTDSTTYIAHKMGLL